MIHRIALSLGTLALVTFFCSLSVVGRTDTPAPEPLSPTIDQVLGLRTGAPMLTSCGPLDDPKPCVGIPVKVVAKLSNGEMETVPKTYEVTGGLVDQVRQEFGNVAPVFLRNFQDSLSQGLAASRHDIRLSCQDLLPELESSVHYRVEPGVQMPVHVETKVSEIADMVFNVVPKQIVVTSGTRTPTTQADAMRTKITLGESPVRLYADKHAAAQVLNAYKTAVHQGKPKDGQVEAMAEVIAAQMAHGKYISNHLRDGAVDLRTKDLTHEQKMAVYQAVQLTPGVSIHEESTPPHFHLDIG